MTTTIIINRPGLDYATITVTAESTAAIVEQPVGSQMYRGLMVDGTFYPLVLCKHVNANPLAMVEATDAALAGVQAAITSLQGPPPRPAAPAITHRITYDRTTRDFACYVQIEGDPEQYIGSADSYHAGETKCLAYRRDLRESDLCISATALDGVCGDCGATLDSMGLCGCRDAAPTPTAIRICEGLQFPCTRPVTSCIHLSIGSLNGSLELCDEHATEWEANNPRPTGPFCFYCGPKADHDTRDCPRIDDFADTSPSVFDPPVNPDRTRALNIDDTQLAAAWRAYQAGAMLWTDVQAIQASLMPRCADHDRPAAVLLNKRPACPACMDEGDDLDMIAGDVGGIVAYVNGKRTIVSPGDY